jgi:hypothetical protein
MPMGAMHILRDALQWLLHLKCFKAASAAVLASRHGKHSLLFSDHHS